MKVRRRLRVGDTITVRDKPVKIAGDHGNGVYGFRFGSLYFTKKLDAYIVVETDKRPYPFENE
jgi:hypothetical protein